MNMTTAQNRQEVQAEIGAHLQRLAVCCEQLRDVSGCEADKRESFRQLIGTIRDARAQLMALDLSGNIRAQAIAEASAP